MIAVVRSWAAARSGTVTKTVCPSRGWGEILNVASVITPAAPSEPMKSFVRS